jgi:hypothetical protein
MKKLLATIFCGVAMPLLSGCVTAGSFNTEIEDSGANATIDSLANPCARPKAGLAKAAPAPSPAVASVALSADQKAHSDMVLGIELLTAANGDGVPSVAAADGSMGSFAQALSLTLGTDLSNIAAIPEAFDSRAAASAEAVLTSTAVMGLKTPDPEDVGRSFGNGEVTISRAAWIEVMRNVATASAGEGWYGAAASSLGSYAKTYGLSASASPERARAAEQVNFKILLARYMADYFRNGEILTLDFDYSDLKTALLEKIQKSVKDQTTVTAVDAEIDKLAKDLAERLCKAQSSGESCRVLGVLGERTFVTRAGKSYGFPGLAVAFDLTAGKKVSTNKIDPNAVIPDLVRVLFEATGDSAIRVPGANNSSLCRLTEKYSVSLCATAAQASLLKKVDNLGDRIEAGTFATVGIAIRGGWLFSLNNEALATSLQTALAVSARKASEGAMWSRLTQCPATAVAVAQGDTMLRATKLRLVR